MPDSYQTGTRSRVLFQAVNTAFLFTTLLLFSPVRAQASSVLQVTFNELVHSSDFIFEGRVIDKRTELNSQGAIHTYVTFQILDVLKGLYPTRTIVLRYLGGAVGDLHLEISDLAPPVTGEKGIYFVESLNRPLVHPLYGWDQGRFLVTPNDGDRAERVLSSNGQPVLGFESGPGKATGLSTGTAAGLLVADSGRRSDAITVLGFKTKIHELLAGR